ncbi:MAG TPA: MoaD/ThiS family protein [Jiangellales bacterium]|nr:MoaD/ThiS family protein [Jiangellales bacterium]
MSTNSPHTPSGVTLRYWASLRAAAGRTEETVAAGTLAAALAQARAQHTDSPRFEAVLGICAVIVDGTPVGRRDHGDVLLGDGSVVELLPPFAGGRV